MGAHGIGGIVSDVGDYLQNVPLWIFLLMPLVLALTVYTAAYAIFLKFAPRPRESTLSEKKYLTVGADGSTIGPVLLPCWLDTWKRGQENGKTNEEGIEEAEVLISVVVPAYNEEERLPGMLEEAVEFLEREYPSASTNGAKENGNGTVRRRQGGNSAGSSLTGWEIIIVSDGSTDRTVPTALDFARNHILSSQPKPVPGPRTPHPDHSTHILPSSIRVVELEANRGKGGAVTHGMRHIRGKYTVFADADGATRFSDLGRLVAKAQEMEKKDPEGLAVVIGSRAHLVGSEAVVKRSRFRNMLMYAFHVFIKTLTTPKTSRIKDTQCGFKLFTRASLPYIIPYMHSEGWIFDVEMLMLAEEANIAMEEVHVGWKEIPGSKLNVVAASVGMAVGLITIRGAWWMGIWGRG